MPLDAVVDSVFVSPGQFVAEGTILARVINMETDFREQQLKAKENQIDAKARWTEQEITSKISALQAEMETKLAPLKAKKAIIEKDATFFQQLFPGQSPSIHPEVAVIDKEIEEISRSYKNQMKETSRFLNLSGEYASSLQLLEEEKRQISKTRQALLIRAPFDGIISNLTLYKGKNIAAFDNLATITASAPTIVTGYISERYQVAIQTGNQVDIESAYQSKGILRGKIVNKGNRIVEIPEKFNRVPGTKQYGMEVFIEMPEKNNFLQKEVLKISVVE